MRLASTVLIAFLSCTCTGSAVRHVEEIKAGLTGLEGRRITSCIGAPHSIDRLDPSTGHELWHYQLPLDADGADWGPTSGSILEPEEERDRMKVPPGHVPPWETPEPPKTPLEKMRMKPDRPGLCTFRFELQGGEVREMGVMGETGEGLSANLECARLLRRCIPEPALEE